MDDVTLGGSQEIVAKDVQIVTDAGHDMGLNINVSKCELIAHRGCHVTDPTLLSFRQIPLENAELLGAPLFPGTALDLTWAKRCDELTRATDRLASIGAQDAITLLRLSFSSPKMLVLHLLRCSSSADNPALQTFDSHLRPAISKITNSAFV